jgi:hypothetical protein
VLLSRGVEMDHEFTGGLYFTKAYIIALSLSNGSLLPAATAGVDERDRTFFDVWKLI